MDGQWLSNWQVGQPLLVQAVGFRLSGPGCRVQAVGQGLEVGPSGLLPRKLLLVGKP